MVKIPYKIRVFYILYFHIVRLRQCNKPYEDLGNLNKKKHKNTYIP